VTKAIYRPNHQLSTINQHLFTHRVSFFILDIVRVIPCPVKSVFFIRRVWQKRTGICHKILFQSRSICDRNNNIATKGLWEWGFEPIKYLYVVFLISRRKGAARKWRERWPSKIDSKWGKHWCCWWFGQKWPSNHIMNDSRIFDHPQNCSSSGSERGFGKEKVVCTFCSTLLDTWAKGRSSHIFARHYRDGRSRHNFLTKWLWEMVRGVLPITPRQSDRALNVLVRYPLGQRKWNSKGITSRSCWSDFSTLKA